MVKKIIFGQFMLVVLAGCSNVSSVYKMDQQGTGRSSMPYTPQYYNCYWNNINAGRSSSQATSTNNIAQFRSHATLNNANINMSAMSNSQATYVSNGAQNDHVSQNANCTPQSFNFNSWCNHANFWNNVNAGSSSSQAASNNNIVQFGNEARLNNVNMDMGAISSSATYASNIFQPYNDHINGHARSSSSRNACPDGMPGSLNVGMGTTNMLHSNSNTAVAVAQSAVYSSSCDHSTK